MDQDSLSLSMSLPLSLSLSGHKDSVTCVCFSYDSALVASGDMSGIIEVWQVDSKEEVWSFEVSDLEVGACMCVVC